MLVRDIMQPRVTVVGPNTSVRAAAALMMDRDIGLLPVCQGAIPIGVVTDRDLTIRLLSDAGSTGDVPVRVVMSGRVFSCHPDHDVVTIAREMGDRQVRRLLVCDDAGRLLGIVTLGDIARDASEELAGQALGEIVECRSPGGAGWIRPSGSGS